jgi:hypothetical protein
MHPNRKPVLVVAGWNLKNARPRVWDTDSPFYLPDLKAIMVSYADFHQRPTRRHQAMEQGLHQHLAVPRTIQIYLDNGAFYFLKRNGEIPHDAYQAFVEQACPDWYPIPQDFIPTPSMTADEQEQCYSHTMRVNRQYQHDGYTPVIHISQFLEQYTAAVCSDGALSAKRGIALGGIVPNLLRMPRALPHKQILESLRHVRRVFADKDIHVFGIGGTATLHIAALLGMDTVDSTGWRNRAARGIVQLLGSGDRSVADLGSWEGRLPSDEEWKKLRACPCPACQQYGIEGLTAKRIHGFCCRATHNLWTLLEEARLVEAHLAAGTYIDWYRDHLNNSIYKPLVDLLVQVLQQEASATQESRSQISSAGS